jgi:hypothetical protein
MRLLLMWWAAWLSRFCSFRLEQYFPVLLYQDLVIESPDGERAADEAILRGMDNICLLLCVISHSMVPQRSALGTRSEWRRSAAVN